MRTLLLTLCACALFLQSCGQKTDQASTSSSTSTDTAAPSGESKAGDGKMPESQKLFMESADKLKNGDAKGCDETLDKAAAAAEKEGDGVDTFTSRKHKPDSVCSKKTALPVPKYLRT